MVRAERWRADRDEFADAVDFVGWYNHESSKILGLTTDDADRLYLAYHEGAGGYRRGSYRKKPGLLTIARRVDQRATRYASQLSTCREALEKPWWIRVFS